MTLDELWRSAGLTIADLPVSLKNLEIRSVQSDSRRVQPGDVFVAIDGHSARGLDFADAARQAGAVAIVHGGDTQAKGSGADSILVDDPREILGDLVSANFGHPSRQLRVIAITGTNGKTTSAIITAQLLNAAGIHAVAVGTVGIWTPSGIRPGGLTTPDPVALHSTFAALKEQGVEAVVIEASSHALVQRRLVGVDIEAAAWTNLSHDHLDYHGDLISYAQAKSRLFTHRLRPDSVAWVNVDQEHVRALQHQGLAQGFTLSANPGAQASARVLSADRRGVSLDLDLAGQVVKIRSPLLGAHNAENLTVAALMALAVGVSARDIEKACPNLVAPPGRLEPVAWPGSGLMLVDYAHTPEALEAALKTCAALCGAEGKLWVVFGCGGDRDSSKRAPMGSIAARYADRCVATSDNPRSESPSAILTEVEVGLRAAGARLTRTEQWPSTTGYVLEPDRRKAIDSVAMQFGPDDVILVAGKGHEKTQTFAQEVVEFDDVAVAAQALQRRWRLDGFRFDGIRAAQCTSGQLRDGSAGAGQCTEALSTDSRNVPTSGLFAALVGDKFDGHDFVDQVDAAGVAGLVVQSGSEPLRTRAWQVEVADTLVALGDLAAAHRAEFHRPVVCITGSNGKTSTKELTSLTLGAAGEVLATYRNHNNRIGVPQTLAKIRSHHRFAVIECGMSIPGEIAELARIAGPDIAVITNVGAAHLEGLGTVEAVATEKTALLRGLRDEGIAVVPADCPLLLPHLAELTCRIVTFGPGGDVYVDGEVQVEGLLQRFEVNVLGKRVHVTLAAIGQHMVTNALAALTVAELLGVDLSMAAANLANYQAVGQRMRPLQLDGRLILEDCYNANPSSVTVALQTLVSLPGPHVAVLGDMLELGPSASTLHESMGRLAGELGINLLLARGEFALDVVRGARSTGVTADVFERDNLAANAILAATRAGGTVLIKGSRGARMERVIDSLKGNGDSAEGGGHVSVAL
ncbi:MAG TPA: UDP-N-acetylmuramoyl-L-alanyl-D-glutamate--2,6-diaminopimelate ligase [Myxococcales bacterium]|nr:UDP-N-acetylmuramoyl-L-alanyl-D-glutamate--2,6-diaminopimelate ligase [Myxococcales bacterium]HAN31949.1 UDP-N-acetylmuramoyl-L-alanyl-D-glutamate--2,6-diaminopimelate ligase [Myxococcales bacterium]